MSTSKIALFMTVSLMATAAWAAPPSETPHSAASSDAAQASHASSHQRPDPQALIKAQKQAMQSLSAFAGVWRGDARYLGDDGEYHSFTQTERIGPFLGGTLMVVEGRGYGGDGEVIFNAFGVMSYSPREKAYTFRSYAQGHAGSFPMQVTEHGFSWRIEAGPVTMRHIATIEDGAWHEVGYRDLPNGKTVKYFEMTLQRVGDTDWPADGAVPMKS